MNTVAMVDFIHYSIIITWPLIFRILDSESAPTEIPRRLKFRKKRSRKHPKKRAQALPFVLARCRRQKKKAGVEQEKVCHVWLENT
jgi:hypothetical protein